ncbi:hypothetical protein MKY82_22115 [Paenibacillus sp. FSL W7-1279]|uniref:hypothetical protein n=1 Tax=Paenibacillus TaxID=44249 RepID=UPI0030D9EFF9
MTVLDTIKKSGCTGTRIQEVIERHKGQAFKERLKDLEADNPSALTKIKETKRKELYYFEVP